MGLPAPGESSSHPPTESLSDIASQLCFPHPTPAQFSFLVPLLFLPTPRALISLPSRVFSSTLLSSSAPHSLLPVVHPGPPQNLGHRTWQLHLDPPKLGVYRSLGTPCPCMTQAAHYLPGLSSRQGIIYPVFWAGFPGDPISYKDFGDGLGTSWWWLQLQSSQAFPYPLGKLNTAAWCSHLPFAMHRFCPTTMYTSAPWSKSCSW